MVALSIGRIQKVIPTATRRKRAPILTGGKADPAALPDRPPPGSLPADVVIAAHLHRPPAAEDTDQVPRRVRGRHKRRRVEISETGER